MLEVADLHFNYRFQKPLFNGLDLKLSGGSLAGLLGLNGAGKTTFLKLLCGLQRPGQGSCRLNGRCTSARNLETLRDLFFVTEETELPALSLRDYEARYAPFYPRFDTEQFRFNLEALRLDPMSKKKLSSCSLGEKRKFLIAFALAANTSLLLLDEPTNGLDIPAKVALRRLLAGAVNEERTILLSTHQIREIGLLLDPVVILDGGRVLLNASIVELSKRLSFSVEAIEPKAESCIHAEAGQGGWHVVRENTDGQETQPDLELLFTAVLANSQRFATLFSSPAPAL